MELQKVIKEQLGIQENKPDEALEILENKKEELKDAIEQIDLLKKEVKLNYFPIWEERLKNDFPKYKNKIVGNWREDEEDWPSIGLILSIEGREVTVLIERDRGKDTVYYGIGSHYTTAGKKFRDVVNKLKKSMLSMPVKENLDDCWYILSQWTSIKEIYPQFKAFVKEFIEKTQ